MELIESMYMPDLDGNLVEVGDYLNVDYNVYDSRYL
jgi:hypothetical protein